LLKRFAAEHQGAGLKELKAFCDNPRNGLPQNAMEIWRRMVDEGII
jgi:hypothetical protein